MSWSWLYGNGIYNLQSVPIITKVVSSNLIHGEVYSIKHYVIMFVSDLRQVRNFLHQYIWQPRYNWNIVESGVKKHKPNHAIYNIVYSTVKMTLHIWYFCVLCMTPYNIVQYIFLSVFRFQSLKWPLNT